MQDSPPFVPLSILERGKQGVSAIIDTLHAKNNPPHRLFCLRLFYAGSIFCSTSGICLCLPDSFGLDADNFCFYPAGGRDKLCKIKLKKSRPDSSWLGIQFDRIGRDGFDGRLGIMERERRENAIFVDVQQYASSHAVHHVFAFSFLCGIGGISRIPCTELGSGLASFDCHNRDVGACPFGKFYLPLDSGFSQLDFAHPQHGGKKRTLYRNWIGNYRHLVENNFGN